MFKTQRHKVEVATGVVIMDSFYLFLQLCNKKEDKQNGLRWLIRFLLSHQPIILKSIFHFSYVAQTVIWRTCIRICDENFYQASKLMFTFVFLHKYRITNKIETHRCIKK